MTLHKLSAGDGYLYYTREVASADELRAADRKLGDYYTVDGNPPGAWGGGGAHLLGVAGEVTEEQMAALYGEGLHPNATAMLAAGASIEAVKLGQRYRRYSQKDGELASRIGRGLGDFERMNSRAPDADERRLIRVREGAQYFRELNGRNASDKEELGRFITANTKPASQAVSGYDLVFAPAKSVSVLWAIGGEEARTAIEAAHHEAIEETMRYLEREAVYTRRGRNGVRQEDVEGGLVYTMFRHYDSRTGDPQLHDHVVVANRVKGLDGKWGTLDGSLLYQFNVAASEHYNRTVTEKVCARLGLGLTERKASGDQPVMEIAGVDVAAIEAASSRRSGITAKLDELVAEFADSHGYAPNKKQLIALAQQATLDTRPAKKAARQLSALVAEWSAEYAKIPGVDVGPAALEKARAHRDDGQKEADRRRPGWRVSDAADVSPEAEAEAVIETLERRRCVWGEHHIDAEVRRRLGSRLGEHTVPGHLFEQVKARAIDQFSLRITPEPRTPEPAQLRLADGASRYGKAHRTMYTSAGVLASEDRLLTAAQRHVIPAAAGQAFERAAAAQDRQLDDGQLALAREFACGDRLLAIGVGPAGTGKTTALKLAADTVREAGGRVFGLAPTAVAAAVMGREIGAKATTIDAFVLAHTNGTASEALTPRPGDMIIVDEAGMVSTPLFAAAVTIAEHHGALVRAIGDDFQLSAVGSGGALRLLKNEVGAVHLEDLHRFRNPDGTRNEAESAATLALREPPAAGIEDDPWGFYRDRRRVVGGDVETMTSAVFEAWQRDTIAGKDSIMMAFDNATVTELNARAQAWRIAAGQLDGDAPTALLRDGLAARAGDVVVTRHNDRQLGLKRGKDFVKNNDVWTVASVEEGGALTVRHRDHGGAVTLPPGYVRAHTMLGYASTIHRTQGITCDTTHALISGRISRALAYVAASRGRHSNHLYGALEDGETLEDMLAKVAAAHDGNLTAHEQMAAERAQARDAEHMGSVYADIDAQANEHRMANLARRVLGPAAEPFISSGSWGAVATHLRHAENEGLNPETLLADSHAERGFAASDDPGAVLAWRIEDRLGQWRTAEQAPGARPLANLTGEHLEQLHRRAVGQLARARADAAAAQHEAGTDPDPKALARTWLSERKGTPWQRRLHGHLSDEDLAIRIRQAHARTMTDAVINDPDAAPKARWLHSSLTREAALRELMPAEQRTDEAYERGPATDRTRSGGDRARAAAELVSRIRDEAEHRRRHTDTAPAQIPDGVPAWLAPADVAAQHDTPAPWRQELLERREQLAGELARRGAELAAAPPAWAGALGPVPSDPERAEAWRLLAAEIDTYRTRCRVPDSEARPIPAKHAQDGTGAMLAARVTAAHKYSAQTRKDPMPAEDNELIAEAAEVTAAVKQAPTPAENVVDELRSQRGTDMPLSPAQARAERIAELARKVRQARKNPEHSGEHSEAVQAALEKIRNQRADEQAAREQAAQERDDRAPRHDRGGPGIGR
ncbi:MobF family relaxase [Sinomonas sp. JGH33]|uniref:MobF family relaxase n=1 Tax=Sinomonas terricola TaxID=3110330 RepID=A0ABU5TB47_9MICC|nr:MobF family relaxase [Sinomonas sp. JGH33]MEA5456915.1 MobF family relaxase [Sinomonas sp. JGH33]